MLRTLPVFLGLLLGVCLPEVFGQGSANAATPKQRHRAATSRESGATREATSAKKETASAKKKPSQRAAKKKPAEVKLKPAPPAETANPPAAATATATAPPSRGPTRIDFDDRLIQGQTNKSGAVYLYDRKELKTRSMIKKRENFRDEILAAVYGS